MTNMPEQCSSTMLNHSEQMPTDTQALVRASNQAMPHSMPQMPQTDRHTYKHPTHLTSHLPLGNARRGVRPESELTRPIEALRAVLGPRTGQRFDVIRTRRSEKRRPIPAADRACVEARDNHACVWCGRRRDLVMDHVVPWSAGGSNSINNLRTLCYACNSYRSNFAHPADLLWRPTPFGFACIECFSTDIERLEFIAQFDHPSAVTFCFWCHVKAPGWPASDAVEVDYA